MRRLLACGVSALITLAGCSSGTPGKGELPFDEYWSMAQGSEEQAAQRDSALQSQYEEAKAVCMKEAGFEYYPQLVSQSEEQPVLNPAMTMDPGSREYRQTYGYGITTINQTVTPEPPQPEEDQNRQYRDGLEESSQVAYDLALYGTEVETDPNVFQFQGGCINDSYDKVYGPTPADAQWADLLAGMYAVDETVMNSPEKAALDQEWSGCMADRSYPAFTSPDDAQDSVLQQRQALNQPDTSGLIVVDGDALAQLQRAEIALAVTDLDCQESVDYASRLRTITAGYQQTFVDGHRSELEAWAAYESGLGG